MTMEAMTYYMKVLHNELKARNVQRPVLLLIDGFSGHLSYDALKFAKENSIFVYCLLANATNILQPCDVAVFQPMKTYYKQEVRAWQMEQEFNAQLTQKEFPKVLRRMLHHVTQDSIKKGFSATGIFPFGYHNCTTLHKIPAQPAEINERLETITATAKPDPKNEIIRYLAVTRSGEVLEAAPETPYRKLLEKKFERQVRINKIFEIYEKF